YEGLAKLFDPTWTAAGYLRSADWLLADWFHWMAENPRVLATVNSLNIWGLILVGGALLLGVFTRGASLAGVFLLALYYIAHPPLPGMAPQLAEGSYLIVNKNVVELIALVAIAIAPRSDFAGLGPYLVALFGRLAGTARRAAASGDTPAHVDPEGLSRREVIASFATLPVLGGFIYAVLKSGPATSTEETTLQRRLASGNVDAVSGASVNIPEAKSLDQLKGGIPSARLGHLSVSRIIPGSNLMNGFSHARDLKMYVSPLVKAYHTMDKVMETLWLAEQCGMNTLIINTDAGGHFIEEYYKRKVGEMQFIAQCRRENVTDRINRAIDLGAKGAYLQMVGDYVKEGEFDVVAEQLEYLRQNGLVAGIGDHAIAPIKQCIDRGSDPDFLMKTLHHDDYWSARPGEPENDNRYCNDREETIEFMKTCEKPWIAFKVLAAGAIHPNDGFRFAFENGADFICVGIYDFQVVEDANITHDILHAGLKRERPWRAT
ncbi:MAG: DoxX family protein, partial [Planctomycetota bacterium]